MSLADNIFIDMCKDVIENGTTQFVSKASRIKSCSLPLI